ncbi:hypothetical protein GQ43DRAFT_391089 [Delitschia confertaspora ATCC 74209]|uniref:Nitrogen permease regulator 3 n=1 Tax=Delitschia confertaspora ATCC 74209 TaxID=1513339 RepID=A0A9P4MTW2_9PLEO|nr:hypothetical protein GQ43DRAFT_391089 [Delitschia confertaspora ATCC 74209]
MEVQLPPASNLHAIVLVTQSRSLGPKLVFHYPPLSPTSLIGANKDPRWFSNETTTGSVASESSSSDWDSSTENEGDEDAEVRSRTSGKGSGRAAASLTSHKERERLRPSGGVWGRQDTVEEDDTHDLDPEQNGDGKVYLNGKDNFGDFNWFTVLGFKIEALEKMLAPGKVFNKKRFELGVESLVFVGAPMFVREDGSWKKRRRWEKKMPKTIPEETQQAADMLADFNITEPVRPEDTEEEGTEESFVYPEGFEPGYGHGLMSGAASGAVSEAGSTRSASSADNSPDMTMFNVVFVLNPPILEYQLRVKDMYDNVTRKYAKALKYQQARSNYVWKESKKILDIKQRAQENGASLSVTWQEIISGSPLAKSMAVLFDAISNDRIAHVHFDATFDTSFQIPQAVSTPYLPSALEPQMPGLWLTTSNVALDEDNDAPVTQHSALLLLEDTETLVKQLESDGKENATPLAFYIRNITPTKSLQKISIKNNIPAKDMEYIAGHLVYWRRARLIPPLHPRDTYIVSPNCDMGQLPSAIQAYAARFPTHSSLPKILSLLSGTPRPYRTIIPSTEHRDAYMEILAWLMRGGWVTQLCTFAWIRVTAEIKAEVAAEMEREAQIKKAEEERRREVEDNESITSSAFSDNNKRSSFLSAQSLIRPATPLRWAQRRENTHEDEVMDASTILSPRLSAYRGSSARAASDAGSTSSNRTTILSSQNHPGHTQTPPKPPRHSALYPTQPAINHPGGKPPSTPSRSSSQHSHTFSPPPNGHPHQHSTSANPSPTPAPAKKFSASVIATPLRASSLEARWLEKICQTFYDSELREAWSMLLKHFDGKHALEFISVTEGLKRKKVAAWLATIKDTGWLVQVRHW